MNSSSKYSPGLTEKKWLDVINRSFIKDMEIKPCVFRTPKSLRDTKPEAYTPQLIGLGPYHHFLPEFSEMETHKCIAVRRFLKQEQSLAFKDLVVDKMKAIEPTIRACYDKYLDFDGDALGWIIAIDGLYLLQYVSTWVRQSQSDAVHEGDVGSLAMDIVMLENQIPVILLKEICKSLQLQSTDALLNDFCLFCKELSPLNLTEESEFQSDFGQVHLLDFMYQLIVNHQVKREVIRSVATTYKDKARTGSSATSTPAEKSNGALAISTTGIINIAANSKLDTLELAADAAAAFGFKGPALVLNSLKQARNVLRMLHSSKESQKTDYTTEQTVSPVDEIDIPSASELCEISKIRFKLTPGGIRDVEFDDKKKIFYLPVITLDSRSEVVLRNLVAYEAESAKPGSSLELAEYVDLMCGIVDTAKDAYLLRKEGIIEGTLTDERIACVFNGIRKSTGNLVDKSNIEMVVKKVNQQWHKAGNGKKHLQAARSLL